MTGFGRAAAQVDGREVTVEIRSVNHRYLDISFRMPRSLSFLEEHIREKVQQRFNRGKVDIYISYRNRREDKSTVIADIPLAKEYLAALREIAQETGLEAKIAVKTVAGFPNVLSVSENDEDDEAVTELIDGALDEAFDLFAAMRAKEGASLKADFDKKMQMVEGFVDDIERIAPDVSENGSKRLMEKMQEYYEGDDSIKQRVLTEAALIADRHAIDEELVRLRSHIEQFRGTMEEGGAVGRKMDFIVQELNRETNTIGNKSQGTEVPAIVIQCKSELEKLREQVQNIE